MFCHKKRTLKMTGCLSMGNCSHIEGLEQTNKTFIIFTC